LKFIAKKVEVLMKVSRLIAITATLTLLTLLPMPNLAAPQGLTSLLATARGQGTLTVGKEEFKVSNVVVKLKEDGTGEITVVTDLQLFMTCTWSAPADLSKGIALKITGGTNAGSVEGSGKLFLRPDGKTIASLSIEASNKNVKRKIGVKFVAE
jgi:ribosomal protein L24E